MVVAQKLKEAEITELDSILLRKLLLNETEHEANREESKEVEDTSALNLKSFLWHGGSAWDAWFSCASNQVAQVLLTLPYSFSQLGFLSGILFQIFYGLVGSWTAYLISVLYLEYRSRKEIENVNFKNHVIQVEIPKSRALNSNLLVF
ncbi:auxin transporter-like protein 2 [Heracleum sosnowskyi]|uniref:Auxin transporter-like protein 2 n=1 Tax=Heracleum sosnowskyi TaxID=360622 RepID=A0AAD8LY74_9APIA|nr:auxin transporter-like protein 2 [Heracleum sosnowskyi]